ncbi:AIM24 family protein, partial [Clostridium saudiense]|nr:AIM24 family protein [Clostridium saudiense]
MRTTIRVNNKLTMISEMINDSTFQVLEYENLSGISSIENTININKLQDCGITLK